MTIKYAMLWPSNLYTFVDEIELSEVSTIDRGVALSLGLSLTRRRTKRRKCSMTIYDSQVSWQLGLEGVIRHPLGGLLSPDHWLVSHVFNTRIKTPHDRITLILTGTQKDEHLIEQLLELMRTHYGAKVDESFGRALLAAGFRAVTLLPDQSWPPTDGEVNSLLLSQVLAYGLGNWLKE